MRFGYVLAIFCVTLGLNPSFADAGEAKAFHDATAKAFAHYRQALFYLKRDAPDVASLELEAYVQSWQAAHKHFRNNPPDIYRNDSNWAKSLDAISTSARKGLEAALSGKSKASAKALKPIRKTIVELRRRNGVFLFTDYVEEANAAFRELFRFRRNPPSFTDENQTNELRRALAVSIHWYEKCRDNAPPHIAKDAQFKRLIEDSLFYLDRMWLAISEKNQLNVVNILRRVVSSDDILWLRFG